MQNNVQHTALCMLAMLSINCRPRHMPSGRTRVIMWASLPLVEAAPACDSTPSTQNLSLKHWNAAIQWHSEERCEQCIIIIIHPLNFKIACSIIICSVYSAVRALYFQPGVKIFYAQQWIWGPSYTRSFLTWPIKHKTIICTCLVFIILTWVNKTRTIDHKTHHRLIAQAEHWGTIFIKNNRAWMGTH
jgi:hypothetical protein